MKTYYYEDDGKKLGPFTLAEIREKRLQERTLVWTDGLESWTHAKNIEEIKDILLASPPPLPIELAHEINKEKKTQILETIKHSLGLAIPFTIVLTILGTFVAVQPDAASGDFPIYLTREEKNNPLLFALKTIPYYYIFCFILIFLFTFLFSKRTTEEKGVTSKVIDSDSLEVSDYLHMMSGKTNEELTSITTTHRSRWIGKAVEAAELELKRRTKPN